MVVGITDDTKIPSSTFGLRTVSYVDLSFSKYLNVKYALHSKQVINKDGE